MDNNSNIVNTETLSEAQQYGETALGGDGTNFPQNDEWPVGSRVDDGGHEIYEWGDGSAIVVCSSGGAWDYRAAGCDQACWDGVGCTCAGGGAE